MHAKRRSGLAHPLPEAAVGPSAAVHPPKRILIVDDLPLTRRGLSLIVEAEPDLVVCGQTGDAAHTLSLIERQRPDLVTVGLSFPDMPGVELIRRIRLRHPDVPILVVSRHDEGISVEQALEAGARGYLTKYEAGAALVDAIHRLLEGETFVSEAVRERLGFVRYHGRMPWGEDEATC
ncbi:response regulator [Rhodocaloribacter sp.]